MTAPALGVAEAPALSLEDRVAALEEILDELGAFALLSVGGRTVKLTSPALSELAKLGEVEQQRIRTALAADPRRWFASPAVRALVTQKEA